MPIYEYRCENGHTVEVLQSMSDDPVTECEECGAPCQRVLHPVAIHFKGSGFHNTDYKKKATSAGGDGDSGGSSSEPKSDSNSGSSDSKKPDSKKSESKAASSD